MPDLEPIGRDVFLQRIADGLPFDEAEKLDILRELASHLADSTARLEADGVARDDAERTALDRLGLTLKKRPSTRPSRVGRTSPLRGRPGASASPA